MSKAFTPENDPEDDEPDDTPFEAGARNCMTPDGHAALESEVTFLIHKERPKIVEIVSWAAGNGDRSENGDYLYNKKRLREIDRRLRYLAKRLEGAEIVNPQFQQGLEQVFFGATVTYKRENGQRVTVKLVGVDEADMAQGKINWLSPVARALLKARIGDRVELRTEAGKEALEIIDIDYVI